MNGNRAGDLAAGIGNGLAYLPLIVVVAFIAFGPLGPATAAVMSAAVFAALLVAGIVLPVLARSPILIAVPSASSALVTGGLFGRLAAEGDVPDVAEAMPGREKRRGDAGRSLKACPGKSGAITRKWRANSGNIARQE